MSGNSFTSALFKYRSYTPLPFLILIFIYNNPNIWSLIIGFIIAVSGELIRLWGVSWVGSETRTTGNYAGTYLVISGPYAFVRNPLYIGNILIYTGIGVMSFAVFPYMQLASLIFFSIQYYLIIKEEEKFLLEKYTDEYRKYIENVPAFIPRLTQYKNENLKQPAFNIKAGLRSEKRSLQAIGFIVITILLIWFVRRF